MSASEEWTTIVSTKGRVVLPKAVQQLRRWEAGTRLVVEDTPDGVLLRSLPLFPPRPEDVYGSLPFKGAPISLEEMEAGIEADAQRASQPGSC